jgi:colicin import membrane protein
MSEDQATRLSQNVEREVRQLIGDLQMQIIVLRSMLELSQQPQPNQPQQQPPPRRPEPQPAPQDPLPPPQPQPQPAPSHTPAARSNGRIQDRSEG